MNTEDFVAYVRTTCVDELVDAYAEMFTGMSITRATDPGMQELAKVWKAASPEMQATMKGFMRLGSQNTAASILALLDEDLCPAGLELTIVAGKSDGSSCSLSRDLLNNFWAQEQAAGRVNQHLQR